MSDGKIYYAKPSITKLEVAYAKDAAANGWGEQCYAYIERFEKEFSSYIGTRYSVATSSATGALHLGLAALEIGPGDEVILADTNWIASVAPVVYLGATPVFVDILPDTWCLDPEKVERAITPRTKAIIATHLYGNLCDMDALEGIASRNNVLLVEDAAEAIGSRWENQCAGARGIFGMFSFHGTKTVTTGEGGMLITNNSNLYNRVRTLNSHGRETTEPRQFWASCVGFKYKMSNIQAAIGCAQLHRIDTLVQRKREIFFYYHTKLQGLNGIRMNPVPGNGEIYGYWMPTVIFEESAPRDAALAEFKRRNIDGRVFFHPLSSMPMFTARPGNTVGCSLAPRALNLPSYHDLSEEGMDRVVAILTDALRNG